MSSVGAVAILPTLLYLATGVIRETAVRTDNENTKPGAEAPVHAALHCVKSLTSNKYARDHRSQEQWTGLLQSALAKIIDLAKTGMSRFHFLLKEQYELYILGVLIYKRNQNEIHIYYILCIEISKSYIYYNLIED